jgi:hypothetical protein
VSHFFRFAQPLKRDFHCCLLKCLRRKACEYFRPERFAERCGLNRFVSLQVYQGIVAPAQASSMAIARPIP